MKYISKYNKKPFQIGLENFVSNTVFNWEMTGKKFNSGNVNLLKYSFYTSVFWGVLQGDEKCANGLKSFANRNFKK
jgi:hypothetical protein